MATRDQEFQEVRRLLGRPKEQRPGSDSIVSSLIRQEQFMMNLLNAANRGWTPNSLALTVEEGTAEYDLYTDDPTNATPVTNWGKALYVFRELESNVIIPVPSADYTNEIGHQGYDLVLTPGIAGEYPAYNIEKIAFYREDGVTPKARIYPVPAEEKVYNIIYATGALDWSTFLWSDVPAMPEWSHLRCIAAALSEIRHCEWSGLTPEQNKQQREEYRRDLKDEFSEQKPEFDAYIRNPQHESSIDTVNAWYEW